MLLRQATELCEEEERATQPLADSHAGVRKGRKRGRPTFHCRYRLKKKSARINLAKKEGGIISGEGERSSVT